ncbi:proteasome assembly chaperone 2 isoform X2 [Phymastichus coffea]|uniref:proteasome assembly chaperone 2 isoform X2 n=1 Tax=Phymastichus coffea TaxID=108790 RepID=UPI00273B972F|nr:proteasome assembly chaperone 2 isoform X2 [Phymastichus coffea]
MLDLPEGLEVTDYTLILPSVSVGNVGQLSVDLLISTLGLRRIGRIFDTSFIPLVGADPYDENSEDICTSIDLYASDEKKLVALQIRSPLVNKPSNFFYEILNFVTDHKISKVIILTSSYGHEKRDEQIRTVPFRYLANEKVTAEYDKKFEELSWVALEPKLLDDFSGQTVLQIHEGDNIPDAIELTNYFNQWLQLIPTDEKNTCKLQFPPSWKFLFGNLPPRELY